MPPPFRTELMGCYDCGNAVAFSAAACPHCGSREPAGPYVLSEREQRLHNIELRNDRNLAVITLLAAALGAVYGSLWGWLGAAFYGFVGLLAGAPIGLLFNLTRRLWR